MVRISESGWRETPAGLKASYDNCGGWMHMALCLKAYLEHGINLRGRRRDVTGSDPILAGS